MFTRFIAVLTCLTLAACGIIEPPPDTAQLGPGAFGQSDNDLAAANIAAWAFAVSARTGNDPVNGARACAAIDYLAGEYSSNPRYVTKSPLTKQELLRARVDVRKVLGVSRDVPSQIVTTALLRFAAGWQAGDQTAALQALAAPGFTLPAQQLLQILTNLPFVPTANVASLHVENQILSGPM